MTARTALLAVFIFVAVALVGGLAVGDSYFAPDEVAEVRGTVVGLQQGEGDIPGPSRYIVQLDGGSRVIVGGTERLLYREGHRVVVREGRTRFFKMRRYDFVRFASAYEQQNNDARGWLPDAETRETLRLQQLLDESK
jgi:hypothetical protein